MNGYSCVSKHYGTGTLSSCINLRTWGTNYRGPNSLHHKGVLSILFFPWNCNPTSIRQDPISIKELLWIWLFALFDEWVFSLNKNIWRSRALMRQAGRHLLSSQSNFRGGSCGGSGVDSRGTGILHKHDTFVFGENLCKIHCFHPAQTEGVYTFLRHTWKREEWFPNVHLCWNIFHFFLILQ